jgi:curli production assembly/transport component CsgG
MKSHFFRVICVALCCLYLSACSTVPASNVKSNAQLSPASRITLDLVNLPKPKEKIAVAVYAFRDQTGQFKPSSDSSYSTSVTQGAASLLVKALNDSGWYTPVEREGLQNLLTERKIVRAIESTTEKGKPAINLPGLMPASLIIEGGVIAYESNVRTGGKGANYLGIGANDSYRVDQVTVNLRMVDIRTGQVLDTVSVTKTIYSYQFNSSIYAFVSYQRLLQEEAGFTTNEPAQLAVREAIESAVIHLIAQGVRDRLLTLNADEDINSPVIQAYLKETQDSVRGVISPDTSPNIGFTVRSGKNQITAVQPLLQQVADPASLKISFSISPSMEKITEKADSNFLLSALPDALR